MPHTIWKILLLPPWTSYSDIIIIYNHSFFRPKYLRAGGLINVVTFDASVYLVSVAYL